MHNFFNTVVQPEIIQEPFPHLIIENALPDNLANELLESMPKFNDIKDKLFCTAYRFEDNGNPIEGSKYLLRRSKIAQIQEFPEIWKHLIEFQSNKISIERWWQIFSKQISSYYPKQFEELKAAESWNYGIRSNDSATDHDFLVDAELVYHAPSSLTTQERGPHIKVRNKLMEFHYLLRHPNDDTKGGDFEIYKFKENCFITYDSQQQIKNKNTLIPVKTIPYKHNQVIAWLNTPNTITAYSPRGPGIYPIHYMAAVFQLPKPLFALPNYSRSHSSN